jgi:glycosyltransferase involved in cell wall biosynthesis
VILFGHPTGNPNSHHAALAYYESGALEAFCVPWMPTPGQIAALRRVPGLSRSAGRLARRWFEPLRNAPRVEGRLGEWVRLARRVAARVDEEQLAYEANDWLMGTMRRECHRRSVTAVHAYEECALWQFQEARRLGKACIYDMPTGYYLAWERIGAELARRFVDWLPPHGLSSSRHARPSQKRQEMELADVVLAPSAWVRDTILTYLQKPVALAPYGVDVDAWAPAAEESATTDQLTFLFAGQISVRKGVPLLLEAWKAADLRSASLRLVGSWQLAAVRQRDMPARVSWVGPVDALELRHHYQTADVFVFPTFFDAWGLVVSEALACGLPVVTTEASGAAELVDDSCGRVVASGNLEQLVGALRYFDANRDRLPAMRRAARSRACSATWASYRRRVVDAAGSVLGATAR